MRGLAARALALGALLAAALFAAACGDGDPRGVYEARGVVREVQPEYDQVVIAHDDIPGLMPAMTMNFDVPDPEVLAKLEKGQAVDFRLEFTGKSYRVVDVTVREGDAHAAEASEAAPLPESRQPAPDFTLVDQTGDPLSLSDLRGQAVVLDFVFTHCPGPCPILTASHVSLQRMLPPEVRERTHFVSVSLDPGRDTPERLRAYARERGADLRDWSFLTGAPEAVADVLARYGVGRVVQDDGTIDHRVVTFLIDPEGRIAEAYLGLEHEPEELARDLRRVLS